MKSKEKIVLLHKLIPTLAPLAPILKKDYLYQGASLVAQLVKNLPATQETWVRSLGWEDPLEKGKTTHTSILA